MIDTNQKKGKKLMFDENLRLGFIIVLKQTTKSLLVMNRARHEAVTGENYG
jgi:hypothetical protein